MKKKQEKQETLGDRLQLLMDEYGLSPEKLALLVGMTGVSIRAISKGDSTPYRSTIEKISKSVGSTYEWLAEGKGVMLPNGKVDVNTEKDPWKDEAWSLAKSQIEKKDLTIDRLSIAFDRLTEFLNKAEVNFLKVVKKTGT